jgi:D-inositol-3-phosphate glycosyltransferase
MRMKIALVSEHASPLAALGGVDAGGQNAHVATLAGGLAGRGTEVVVHTRRDDPDTPRRVSTGTGVTVDHVPAGPAEPMSKDLLFPHMEEFADDLRRQWSRERPDVVHSHFWMSGYAAVRAALPLGIPVVHTFHALGVVKKREQGTLDTSPGEREHTETSLLYQAERILATSCDEAFELLRLGADRGRVSVVPCGVDVSLFTPEGPAAPRGRAPRVLYAGRLTHRKGIDTLIAALAEVPRAELVIAGGPDRAGLGGDPEVGRLRALADAYGVLGRVSFLGRVEHAELPALYRSADLMASVPWYEPFGIAVVEAMACGVPVVVSAVGGMADTVIDQRTGLHVPPRRPDRVAEALNRLLADASLRHCLGAAGRERAVARYGQDRVVAATLRAYAATVDDCSPRAAARRPRGRM